MNETVIRNILLRYGLIAKKVFPHQSGYRNRSYRILLDNDQDANVIIYKNEEDIIHRIKRAHQVALQLSEHGMPVRVPIDPRITVLETPAGRRYSAVYTYLPGHTIPWEAYTKDHLKLVGMSMSDMHHYLNKASPVEHNVCDEYGAVLSRMIEYFARDDVTKALAVKLQLSLSVNSIERLRELNSICHHLPDQQILHMDFVRGNLVFDIADDTSPYAVGDVALSGIIDFEKTAFGHPAYDIARTLAFLIVDCKYKKAEEVTKYFLRSGYNKRGKQRFQAVHISRKNVTYDLLDELTTLFLVHDFYKFLRHNPYESLSFNEHFVRTRDVLVAKKVLKYS